MKLVCPECQNDVDLSNYPLLNVGDIVECNTCGITLMMNRIETGLVEAEVVDEGK